MIPYGRAWFYLSNDIPPVCIASKLRGLGLGLQPRQANINKLITSSCRTELSLSNAIIFILIASELKELEPSQANVDMVRGMKTKPGECRKISRYQLYTRIDDSGFRNRHASNECDIVTGRI